MILHLERVVHRHFRVPAHFSRERDAVDLRFDQRVDNVERALVVIEKVVIRA